MRSLPWWCPVLLDDPAVRARDADWALGAARWPAIATTGDMSGHPQSGGSGGKLSVWTSGWPSLVTNRP